MLVRDGILESVPTQSSDRYLEDLGEAIALLMHGCAAEADMAAQKLVATRPERRHRKSIPSATVVSVLRRDGFQCRYCEAEVVPPPVLRAASSVWSEEIPYNRNGRADAVHPIYVMRSASIDHVNPHAHAGGDEPTSNLVTACWPCNAQKGEFTLDRLGWEPMKPPSSGGWDGFVPAYPMLWATGRQRGSPSPAEVRYHSIWHRALGLTVLPPTASGP